MPKCTSIFVLFLCFLCFCHKAVLAQNDSVTVTIDSSRVRYYTGSLDSLTLDKLHDIDTTLNGFQIYDPIAKKNRFYAGLGNIGLASYDMVFQPGLSTGFRYGISAFNPYLFSQEDIRYYQLLRPYTCLFYANGPKKEQLFRVTHSQNLYGKVMVGLDFRFMQSFGLYERQKTDNKNLNLTAQYFSENKRYGIMGTYIHDKNIMEENGGIQYDSLFTENLENDRKLFDINLGNAENTVKHASVFVNQYFFLSRDKTKKAVDSLDSIPVRTSRFHLGKISYAIKWERDQFLYTDNDPTSAFYSPYDTVIDSTMTHDTSFVAQFHNDISWSNLGLNDKPEDKPVYLYLGARHTIIKTGDTTKTWSFSQLIPYGGFSVFVLKSFRLNFDMDFVIGEYNGGDFSGHAQIQQYLGNKYRNLGLLILDAHYVKNMPSWFYKYHYGNNFRWDNQFSQQEIIVGSASYRYKKLHAGVKINQLRNLVILGSKARPTQIGSSFSVMQAFVNQHFRFGEFGIQAHLTYQKSTKQEAVSVPDFIGYLNFNFTTDLFHGVSTLQPGVSIYYNTAYHANAYMPALQDFYTNNTMKTGNYIIATAYLNFKLKRARLFFKYNHFNAGWLGYEYMAVPHYPLNDAAFKFGLSWRFWD